MNKSELGSRAHLDAAFARAAVSVVPEDARAFRPHFARTLELMEQLRERIASRELTSRDEPDATVGGQGTDLR